jgi:hypothetical protein
VSGIIAASISGGCTVLAVAISGWLQLHATGKVHTLVNNRSEKQDLRIEQLTNTLKDSGTDIPNRPSLSEE